MNAPRYGSEICLGTISINAFTSGGTVFKEYPLTDISNSDHSSAAHFCFPPLLQKNQFYNFEISIF